MRLLLLGCLLLLGACQSTALLPVPVSVAPLARDHADFGRIYETASGRELSPEQLVERLSYASRVLVGEQHDNPDHHALQLWLVRALVARREQGSVLMEMINPQQQANVALAQQQVREGKVVPDPISSLTWQPGWDWSLYGPLVMYLLRQPAVLLAANLDRREVLQIYQQPPSLVGARASSADVSAQLQEDIRQSHCGLLPESQIPAMLAVQQQRDRRMAEAMLGAPQPSLLLAGAFHVRKDLGVPLHLADLQAEGRSAVLLLAEVGREVSASMADYVWFTAALPAEDHCARLR